MTSYRVEFCLYCGRELGHQAGKQRQFCCREHAMAFHATGARGTLTLSAYDDNGTRHNKGVGHFWCDGLQELAQRDDPLNHPRLS